VPATLVNYFLNSYWTFRDTRQQRAAKAEAARGSIRQADL
jgi:putative flippase GtrA